jgi:hypothetical protein
MRHIHRLAYAGEALLVGAAAVDGTGEDEAIYELGICVGRIGELALSASTATTTTTNMTSTMTTATETMTTTTTATTTIMTTATMTIATTTTTTTTRRRAHPGRLHVALAERARLADESIPAQGKLYTRAAPRISLDHDQRPIGDRHTHTHTHS